MRRVALFLWVLAKILDTVWTTLPTPNPCSIPSIPREADECSVSSSGVQSVSRNLSSSLEKKEAAKVTNQRIAQALVEQTAPRMLFGSRDLLTVAVPVQSLDLPRMKNVMQ